METTMTFLVDPAGIRLPVGPGLPIGTGLPIGARPAAPAFVRPRRQHVPSVATAALIVPDNSTRVSAVERRRE
jgi:hypothetical protein